ncbi:SusE domain-containing protein [Pontibacter pamirensis]|uniref:SusE domain-containing protein n=1 Tax=Pontibacter pamirensis TaxID=2562824 RepID=UPI001389A90E|nr:SusE domain-containing protein [Pontibacter pamirensis]
MKTWINRVFILTLCSLALFSCEKDEDRAILRVGTAPMLQASMSSIVLTEEDAANDAVALSWSEADFGYGAAVEYTLQIDTAGNNFATPYTASMGNDLEVAWTVEELNTLLTRLNYTPDEAQDLPIRIMATVSDMVDPVYSNVSTISVTPYSTFVEPGYLYVPGAYQGWAPATAPALTSVEDNGIYFGIIDFSDAEDLNFKFTPERNWDTDYGMGDAEGTLSPGGGNLSVPTADTYRITVNLNTNTWSFTRYSWGLIGSATSTGWDGDLDMEYDYEEGVWRLTTDLTAGAIKFRLNDDWALNYGDNNANDDLLDEAGSDIMIEEAGTYEIVLDLETEDGTPTYSVTRQ